MEPHLHLDQLSAFQHVVAGGSFGRAAIALGVGQPAVSARIKALEEAVGGALFTRGRRVALTALGEAFLPFARRALEVIGEGIAAAQLAQTGRRGHVRFGSLASLAGGLVGPALDDFIRKHPNVDCTVKAGDHEFVVQLLLDGMIELGIHAWPCTEAGTADFEPLLVFHEPVVLVARPDHPIAGRGAIGRAELVKAPGPLFRLRWWQAHHPDILRLAEATGRAVELPMETARNLTLSGTGIGFFAKTYIAEDLLRGSLVEVKVKDMPCIHRESALVRRRSAPLSPALANLIEVIRVRAHRLGLLEPSKGSRKHRRRNRRAGRLFPVE